ncbi:MAG: zinc finger HIT domain-containing protein [Halanaeroarchaeum sp.]
MSVSGLCEICERGEATHACDRCGALVCSEHYDESSGLCSECAAAGGGRRL